MDQNEARERIFLYRRGLVLQNLEQFKRLNYAITYHRNIRGEQMRFDDKPYLVEIYKDDSREIVLKSSVQTGKSEFLIVSAHAWAEHGLQVLYVLPTIDIRNLFVANRIDKLYEKVPHYQLMLQKSTGSSNSRGLKHFGTKSGAIFFAGSNSKTTFIEKPIDLVVGDETDRFDQANYALADDRMTASPYKLKYEASNPTVDNHGIDKRWRISDQREWFLRCGSCNYWQQMDWFSNVVRQTDDEQYVLMDRDWSEDSDRDINLHCIRCGSALDRYDTKAQWVAKHPKFSKKTHGYHIHQLQNSFVELRDLWTKFNSALFDDTEMQVFYNSVLGETFAGKGSKLTDEILNRCKEDYSMPTHVTSPCFMGVDVGKVLHVTVWSLVPGGRLRLVYAGTVREFEELDYLFARFNIVTYCIDAMPETRKATEYANKHTGRGWICRYHKGLDEMNENMDKRQLSVDRTQIMDRVLKFFMERRLILPRNAQSLDRGDFYKMLKMPTRIFDAERNCYDWLGDPDHYYHSTVYALISYMARGDISVMGLDISGSQTTTAPPSTFQEAIQFPPGTPEHIIRHYKQLYEQGQALGKMNKDE